MDLDVLLSYLYDNAPGLLQEGSRAAIKQAVPGVAGGLDYFAEKSGEAFAPMSFEDDEEDKARKAKIAEMFGARDAAAAAAPDPVKQQSDLDKLLAAGQRASGQREFMQGTEPLVEDYDKGIAIGGDPSRGSKDEIIARIRAQAAKMAGREGPSAGGGGFSQGTMTPEISQRLSERDAWAAQQPMRDAVWDIDVARQRGDTAGQDSAAGRLQSMQQQASIQSKQDAINSLLSKVTDKTGKIDPDTYQKLGMLGQYVPSSMVGKGKEQTLAEFDALIASGSETISQLAPQAVFDPSGETSNRVAAERKGIQLLTQLKQMIANGQMTAEEASATFQQAMMMDKYVQGWLAEKMMPQPGQLQQGE